MSKISLQTVYVIGDGKITNLFLWAVPMTVASVLMLEFLFLRTKIGKGMRAVAENVSLARLTGINIDHIRRLTWIIGGGLAGVAGSFWAIFTQTNPEIGWLVLLRGFAASTIGGLSSFLGTIVGGYIVGLSENLFMDMLNRYLGLEMMLKPAITFGIMVIFLVFKPTGLVLEHVNIQENLVKVLKKMHLRQ
jgi:branched-subunit amino acid ABC-type transport system permease component